MKYCSNNNCINTNDHEKIADVEFKLYKGIDFCKNCDSDLRSQVVTIKRFTRNSRKLIRLEKI